VSAGHRPGSPRRPMSVRGAKRGAVVGAVIALLLTALVTVLNGRAAPVFLLGMLFLLIPLGAFLGAVLTGVRRRGTEDAEPPESPLR
jgi:uncharacterized integral membrane protein